MKITCSCGAKFKTAKGQGCHARFIKDNKDHVIMPLITTKRVHPLLREVALTVEEELKQTLQGIEGKIKQCQNNIDQLKSYNDEMCQLDRERTIISVALEQLTKEREEVKWKEANTWSEAPTCETT